MVDFPNWGTCYKYFQQWSERPDPEQDSILEQVLKKNWLVGAARQGNGRKEQTSFCIVDSQSVKNTDSAEAKGYDAGKKVSGIKRHIAVDTEGLPHAIHVTTAHVTDRAGALAMFDRRRENLRQVQQVLVDGGYTGKPFAEGVQSLLGAAVAVVKWTTWADRLPDLWRWKNAPSTAFRKADYQSLEGVMDVSRGAVRASSPGLDGGRDEPSGSLPGVRPAPGTRCARCWPTRYRPGYRRQDPPRRPNLGPCTGVIDAILEADRQVPRKQRHTAKRVFERLRDEHGFDGQYTIVKD